MGREANCRCQWNGTIAEVKALLEPPHLILRGGPRSRIPFAEMKRLTVDGDQLHFTFRQEKVCLILGKDQAPKWAKVILTPPPTLAKKLGIEPAFKIRILGTIDDDALQQALAESQPVTRGSAALVIARVNTLTELNLAFEKTRKLLAEGVPIWIVYRKGPAHPINESDVRSTGLAAGIVDVKVASVSRQLTALKFVKRKNPIGR